jgi:hypothetical protein
VDAADLVQAQPRGVDVVQRVDVDAVLDPSTIARALRVVCFIV